MTSDDKWLGYFGFFAAKHKILSKHHNVSLLYYNPEISPAWIIFDGAREILCL